MVGLIRGLSPKKPDEPTTSPDGFWEAVEECWLRDPSERPTAASLLSSLPLRAPTSSFYTIQSESHLRGSKKRPCSPSASSDSIESEVEDISIYAKKRNSQVCPADSSTYELIEPFDLDEWPTESPPQSSLPSQSVVRLSTFQASLQSFDLSEPPPSSISPNHHSGVEYETLPVDLPLSWFTVNEEKKPKLFSSDLDDDLFCLSEEAVEDSRLTEHEGGGQRAPKGLSPTISMTDPDYRSIEILDAWKKITSVFQSSVIITFTHVCSLHYLVLIDQLDS